MFQRRHFFQGQTLRGESQKDIHWLSPEGSEMTDADWHSQTAKSLGVLLNGLMTDEIDPRGRPITGSSMLLILNGWHGDVTFSLPKMATRGEWCLELNTAQPELKAGSSVDDSLMLIGRSMAVLRYDEHRWTQLRRLFHKKMSLLTSHQAGNRYEQGVTGQVASSDRFREFFGWMSR